MKKYKYKVVVKIGSKTFIKKSSNDKLYLESYASKLSKKHPAWSIYVSNWDTLI